MLRLAPEVPKSDSPLLTQALWRRGCGARRHNPLHTRRRATRTGSHRDGRQAASRHAHPFLDPPPYPRYSFYDLHHNQAIPQPRTAHTNAFHTHSSNRTLDCQLAYHDAKLRSATTCSCHRPTEANHKPRSHAIRAHFSGSSGVTSPHAFPVPHLIYCYVLPQQTTDP